jgi:hypothetical protein
MKRKRPNFNSALIREQLEQRRNTGLLTIVSKEIDLSTLVPSRRNKKQVKQD